MSGLSEAIMPYASGLRVDETGCVNAGRCANDRADAAATEQFGSVPGEALPENVCHEFKIGHGGARKGAGRKRNPDPKPRVRCKPQPVRRVIQSKPLGLRWYVVEVPTGAEQRVIDKIAKGEDRPGFEPRPPFETFLPLTKDARTHRGKRVIEEFPMIEGYGFVRFDAVRDSWTPILRCKGVATLFRTRGGRPIPVSDKDILRLRKSSDADLGLNPLAMKVREPGTMLRVADGAFTSFPAVCVECNGINTRALVQIFGRETSVLLPWESFEAI